MTADQDAEVQQESGDGGGSGSAGAPRRRRLVVPTRADHFGELVEPLITDDPEIASQYDVRLWRRIG